jgi:protein-L-isoaspartate O-methyltransferase
VYGIDYIEPLVHLSERNINADDKDLIASGRIKLYTKDGWQGLPDEAPFDAIHVGAAADSVPQELVTTNLSQAHSFITNMTLQAPVLMRVEQSSENGVMLNPSVSLAASLRGTRTSM